MSLDMIGKRKLPTAEGRRRYPFSDGYYHIDGFNPQPCTCVETCDDPCKGGCGCQACHDAYQDFLSNDYE